MKLFDRYNQQAETYAKYRPDFAPETSDKIFEVTQLSNNITVADIGAGTGKLTQHFIDKVKTIFAVEPNQDMRRTAEKLLGNYQTFSAIDGTSEQTNLPDHSIDLIIVGRAIRWFNPEPTKQEFKRILKPQGWLVLVENLTIHPQLNAMMKQLKMPEYGWETSYKIIPKDAVVPLNDLNPTIPSINQEYRKPVSFYYGHDNFPITSIPFSIQMNWQEFLGYLLSLLYFSAKPSQNNNLYDKFETFAKEIFDQFSVDNILTIPISTYIWLGQVKI